MQYQQIPEEFWGSLRGCVESSTIIRERCTRLLTDLKKIFDDAEMRAFVGLGFEEPEGAPSDVLALLESPLGSGRVRLDWGLESNELVGIAHVEKKVLTPEDGYVWVPVWGIVIPQSGNPFTGPEGHRFQVRYDRILGDGFRNSLFECGMSMLCAISVKPV